MHHKLQNMITQTQNEYIDVYAEATPNPETMKFVFNKMIKYNSTYFLSSFKSKSHIINIKHITKGEI